jgi:hypothetical protein
VGVGGEEKGDGEREGRGKALMSEMKLVMMVSRV